MESYDVGGLFSTFDSLYSKSEASPLHVFITAPQIKIDQLPKAARGRQLGISLKLRDNGRVFSVTLTVRRRLVRGWLLVSASHWIFLIRPSESSAAAREIAQTWINKMYPAIDSARISPDYLVDFLEELSNIEDSELHIHSYSLAKQGESEYKVSAKAWQGRKVFNRRELQNFATTTGRSVEAAHISLISRQDRKTIFECRISISGHLILYAGNESGFSAFNRLIIEPVTRLSDEFLRGLEGLEARENEKNEFEVTPLVFHSTKSEDRFDLEIETLKESFSKEPRFALSVNHSGNPWYAFEILDKGDGSVYDLHVFKNQAKLVPLIKATPQSLSLLTSMLESIYPRSRHEIIRQ